ncbi:MAG: hypothetical protein QM759_07700 [Terricaulis sp.]
MTSRIATYNGDAGVLTRPQGKRQAYVGRTDFRRLERVVVLAGGLALGGLAGFTAEIMLGRPSVATLMVSGTILISFALYLCTQTLRESFVRRAYGCATATILHAGALLAWPMAALFAPLSPVAFWMAPVAAVSALVLFASCWGGPPRAVYRLSLQGFIVAAAAMYQGALLIMAG